MLGKIKYRLPQLRCHRSKITADVGGCRENAVERPVGSWDERQHWKVNGNELIYVKELKSAAEAVAVLHTWMLTAKEDRNDLKRKRVNLDVKLAAWTAGFPVANTEVIFPREHGLLEKDHEQWAPEELHFYLLEMWYSDDTSKPNPVRDFIGPSIDTGFRLAARANPRKFIISVELAMLWSVVTPLTDIIDINVRYDGLHELKGVLHSVIPYPLFWIDTMHDDRLMKCGDELTRETAVVQGSVQKFCAAFIADHDTHVFRPFIFEAPEAAISIPPENYLSIVEYMNSEWEKIKLSGAIFIAAVGGENEPHLIGEELDPLVAKDFKVKDG